MDEKWTREEVIKCATEGALGTWTHDIMGGSWRDQSKHDRWCLTVKPTRTGWRYTIRGTPGTVFGPPRSGHARSRLAAIQAARQDWVALVVEALLDIMFPNP